MNVSFSKPADGTEVGATAPIRASMNYFAQPNIASRIVTDFAGSLRRHFQDSIAIRSTHARLWSRQAFIA
ncbi:MAG: hypothetical protein GW769_06620 [Alphaproteobacteria bacterium]|nr:hypothetical protein [Alphaproteobacteria bacterium]